MRVLYGDQEGTADRDEFHVRAVALCSVRCLVYRFRP